MTNAVNLASAAGTGFAFRNRIINGDMRIDQRNGGAAVTPAGTVYTLDRWSFEPSQASKITIQQLGTGGFGFTSYLRCLVAATATVGANDFFGINQPIEGNNIADLGWGAAGAKTVTLSFWAYSTIAGTYGGSLRNANNTRSYVFTYVLPASTWTYITITIPGDTTGAWNTDSGRGVTVYFGLGLGSTFSTTPGSWVAGNYATATGATSIMGTLNAVYAITGVQFEVGTIATPFERRPYGFELALCQRYYEIIRTLFQTCSNAGLANSYISTITYKVQKRVNPTVTIYSVVDLSGSANFFTFYPGGVTGGANIEAQSIDGIALSRVGVNTYNLMTGSMVASAEL